MLQVLREHILKSVQQYTNGPTGLPYQSKKPMPPHPKPIFTITL